MVSTLLNSDKVQNGSIKWRVIKDHATFEDATSVFSIANYQRVVSIQMLKQRLVFEFVLVLTRRKPHHTFENAFQDSFLSTFEGYGAFTGRKGNPHRFSPHRADRPEPPGPRRRHRNLFVRGRTAPSLPALK